MAITTADGVNISDGDEVPVPLTAEERRALLRVEEAKLAKVAASSGKGRPPSALDQCRASVRPAPLPPGIKIHAGPIASTPYTPSIDFEPRVVDHLLPLVTKPHVNTHPHIAFWQLARVRTNDLFAFLANGAFPGKRYRIVRAMILIELAYRLRLREGWIPDAIWNVVFEHTVPPPRGLRSPSEAFPHERRWALH